MTVRAKVKTTANIGPEKGPSQVSRSPKLQRASKKSDSNNETAKVRVNENGKERERVMSVDFTP